MTQETPTKKTNTAQQVSIWKLFTIFAKIGCFTFGGGLVMLPFMEREIVEKRDWMQKEDFIDMLAVTNSVPGAFAINASIFIGYRLKKIPGAVAAAFGTVMPSFLVIVLFAALISQHRNSAVMQNFFLGVRPAVAALIFAAAFRMGRSTLKKKSDLIMMAAALALALATSLHPALLILAGALAGIVINSLALQNRKSGKTG